MTFNKSQKIITAIYIFCLVLILLFLTPYTYWNNGTYSAFGNFFIVIQPVLISKLLIEFVILTVIYYLSLIIFKNKS